MPRWSIADAGRRAARYAARGAALPVRAALGRRPGCSAAGSAPGRPRGGPPRLHRGARAPRAGRRRRRIAQAAFPARHGRRPGVRLLWRGARRAAAHAHRLRGRDGARALPRPGRRRLSRGGLPPRRDTHEPARLPDRRQLAEGLDAVGADGWLLFDFHGLNPVAGRVLGIGGMGSRRLFVLLPREGEPVAVAHKIELQPLAGFPGRIIPYARWEELHAALGSIVQGRTRGRWRSRPTTRCRTSTGFPAGVVRAGHEAGRDGGALRGAGHPLRGALERRGTGRPPVRGGGAGRGRADAAGAGR